jgi:hypothetical protein
MKTRLLVLLLSLSTLSPQLSTRLHAQPSGAPTTAAVSANMSTGALTAPVTAATFRSANSIQTLDADLTSWAAITRASGFDTFAATPSSANLLALISDETGTGSAVFATSPTLVTPNLGTPSALTLTNATGLPVASGISGLGTGVATFLATPTSANLAAALTNETGSGSAVFATSPTLTAPVLGAATATSITGPSSTTLTLQGGSSGARVDLGQGTGGRVSIYAAGAVSPLRADKGATSQATNTAVGESVLDAVTGNTTGVILGSGEVIASATGNYNTGVGQHALRETTYGEDNTAVGAQALRDNTIGFYNTAVGHYALGRNTTGDRNTSVGVFALETTTTGYWNTAHGFRALNLLAAGHNNTAVGHDAMRYATTATYGTAIGTNALNQTTTASGNIGVGRNAGYDLTTGGSNTIVGSETGRGITTGTGNTIIGAGVIGLSTGLTNNIILANGTGTIKAQHDGSSSWTLSDGLVVTGNLSAAGLFSVTRGGASSATIESTVNGALSELIVKGKNSSGTAREVRFGLNKYADDVASLYDGTTERIRVGITSGNVALKTGAFALESTSAGYVEGTEQGSSPTAPSSNGWRLYAKDNGSGKTVLYVRFASGAEQQVAIEP